MSGANQRPSDQSAYETVGPSGRTAADWQKLQQDTDLFRRECACRAALDRINLGLHTSEDVALLRRELNL